MINLPECPYLDKECPKVAEIEEKVSEQGKDIKTIYKYLYIIMGMVAVNWGFTLW